MTKIVQEDLWKPCDMWIVTTNSFIKRNGALAMGKGAAKQAVERFPHIPSIAGKIVLNTGGRNFTQTYGFLVTHYPTDEHYGFGIFQVKGHWREWASLDYIKTSVDMLTEYANKWFELDIRMNYPGIGNGGLKREDVEPLITSLPDNVTICYR